MFTHLKNILSKNSNKAKDKNQTEQLNQTHIASAIILLEAAHSDDNCSKEEMAHISATIQSSLNLSPACATELLEMASAKREEEVDIWQFTNLINSSFSHAEKIAIIESVWHIILIDGHLDHYEDHFAHKLANLLRLTHKELIDAKMKVKGKVM